MKLLSDTYARAIELSYKVGILTVRILVSQDEISSPDEGNGLLLHAKRRHDLAQILIDEVVHQGGEHGIGRLVGDVLGARGKGSGDATIRGFLVDDLRWLVVYHVDADLALHYAGQEALVDELTICTFDVLLAELHEVVHRAFFLVVVDGLLEV